MANLSLRHIYKVYSNGCKAVNDFNLEIKNNEFVVFVGPSGCGKSTTLRMVAGLEDISAGELYIDNVLVNGVEPKDRDISMVFQNYALYPHMTVYDNMAFGLKLRHVPQDIIHKKVLWAAEALKLTDYLDKKPRAMSGGQRQRVALGRAILRNPKVFLLDEPLSNLDAKLRTEMRAEIAKLHQTIKTTFIYVTHDQVEAMTLGTKVVVMRSGFIQQVDTPQNLYNYPCNKFVAGFIGTPQMNFFEATLHRKGANVNVKFENCSAELNVDLDKLAGVRPNYLRGEDKIIVGLRCENISLDPDVVKKTKNKLKVKISHFEELGSETLVYCDLNLKETALTGSPTQVIIKLLRKDLSFKAGEIVEAAFDMNFAHYFDAKSEESIKPIFPKENIFDCSVKNGQIEFLKQKIKLPSAIKCEDVKDAELFIPTDAISCRGGNLPAKVLDIKMVQNQQVVSLKMDNRTFYVITNEKLKVGQSVKVAVDITQISVKQKDKVIIANLPKENNFVGAVINLSNEKKAINSLLNYYEGVNKAKIKKLEHDKNIELGNLGLSNEILKDYKAELNEYLKKEKWYISEKIGLKELGKKRLKEEKYAYKKRVIAAKEQYKKKCEAFKTEKAKKVIDEAVKAKAVKIEVEFKNEVKLINDLQIERAKLYKEGIVNALSYCKSCVEVDQSVYQKAISQLNEKHNKIISSIKKEIGEYASKEQVAKVALDKEVNKINQDFEKQINASSDKKKELTLKRDALISEKREKLFNKIEADKAALNDKLKAAEADYNNEKDLVISASKTFFMDIFGSYLKLSPIITRKIVQALGVSIFNVQYRFAIGLDSLTIVDNNKQVTNPPLKVKVVEFLDYGKDKFISGLVNGEKIIVRANKVYKKDDIVNVCYNLDHISVFENKLDIRLY